MKNNGLNRTKLLYPEEHIKCLHYVSDSRCFFKHFTLAPGERFPLQENNNNHIVFIIEGSFVMNDTITNNLITIENKRIVLIPQYMLEVPYTETGCQIVVCSFDVPLNICDKLILKEIQSIKKTFDYQHIPIKEPMSCFLDLILFYLQNEINCEHMHEIKQKEIFLIFKWFYTKEELAQLFRPLNGKYYEFRRLVMKNYEKASDVAQLASLVGMSRTRFDVKFKEEFGISPRQWMLKQLARKIHYAANEPGITIDVLVRRFNFNSNVSFTRFCKSQFGHTPGELIGKKAL